MTRSNAQRPTRRQRVGRLGEEKASEYLQNAGLQVWATNVRCSAGEIDILAGEDDCLVFVEVRTRVGSQMGLPEESLDRRKQRKLVEVAETYIQETNVEVPVWRIDVVAIELSPVGSVERLAHIRNAISESET